MLLRQGVRHLAAAGAAGRQIPAADLGEEGLKYVTDRSYVPVLADESVFSPEDAVKIMAMRAATEPI